MYMPGIENSAKFYKLNNQDAYLRLNNSLTCWGTD